MKMNFAILGAGRIGQVHALAINSIAGANLFAVSDVFASAAEKVALQYGCKVMTIEEIEVNAEIDAVIICTPTDTHADLIERFCRVGKAVFCEKPVDLDLARVQKTLNTVNAEKGRLMVGFQRRFDPDFAVLKKEIDNGAIGQVEMINIISRDPGAPPVDYIKRSGGIFKDMTIHDLDMARWLLGEEVATVQAAGSVLTDPSIKACNDFDSVNVLLTTHSGKQCVISNSRRATFGYDQRIEVHGSMGSISAKNHHLNNIEIASAGGYVRPALQNFFMTRYQQAYYLEMAAFLQALTEKSAMPVTGDDGLQALALAQAAGLSIQEARVVKVSEIL